MIHGKPYSSSDLEEICLESEQFFSHFKNKSILVAGATGFIGSWLIATLEHMNLTRKANIEVVALSRRGNIDGTKKNATRHLLLDVGKAEINFPEEFDCIFNAITPSSSQHGGLDPRQVLDASISGTANLLQLAARNSGTCFINLSSGIVAKRLNDSDLDLDKPSDAYLLGKRKAEELVQNAIDNGGVQGKNLRLYAFAGPGIPLDQHFAVGNFMSNAKNRKPIQIKGNPDTIRSYLYPTDLVINILKSTVEGTESLLEVGSRVPINMAELANLVNRVTGNNGVIQNPNYGDSDVYFPNSTSGYAKELISIDVGLGRWYRWLNEAD
jgi:nucleoside-diphosphate-sugar epimerase